MLNLHDGYRSTGLSRTYANLMTVEGKDASFLAGGSFPFPTITTTPTGGATAPVITVQFKPFGVKLDFTPTITPQGAIAFKVAPEVSSLDFANAFHVVRELGQTAEGELLSLDALRAIHWTHRLFALVALAAIVFVVARAWRLSRGLALMAALLVTLQFALGVLNVALGLPLGLAAAHNAGAALLLVALVVLNFFAFRGLRPSQ